MSDLFSKPTPQQEDSSVKALRDAEQARAEADRIKSIQSQLGAETQQRAAALGVGSLFGALGRRRGLTSLLGSG